MKRHLISKAVMVVGLAVLPFMAQAATDLSITVIDSPNPVQRGATLTYFITATNHGPEEARRAVVDAVAGLGVSGSHAHRPPGVARE